MKTGFALVVLLAASFTAFSQAVENDDMYFSSKDRTKQDVLAKSDRVSKQKRSDAIEDKRLENTSINPTDSYSARNINPEYVSRSKSGDESEEVTDEAGYFTNSYTPSSVNKNLYNNYSSNGFYSPYYGNGFNPYNYYGNYGMAGMYSPYGMYGMGGMGYRPGLTLGLGYGMGSMYNGWYGSMGYGMGMGYGMYSPYSMFYDPFYYGYGYGSMMYGGMYGMYNPWMYGGGYGYGYGYPGSVIVVNENSKPLTYQRRSDRSRVTNNNATASNSSRNITSVSRSRSVDNSAGRVSSSSAQSQNYYNRGWRNNGTVTTNSRSQWNSSGSNSNSNSGRMRSWGSSGNSNGSFGGSNSSSWGNSGGGSGSHSRSSWSNGGGNSSFGSGGSFGGGSRGSFGGGSGGGSHSGGGGGGRRH
jgi:hypothetical protein